jgi:hypothetical protein
MTHPAADTTGATEPRQSPQTKPRVNKKLLGIYLNDHLAGSTVGIELAKRSHSANRGTEVGRFLEWLIGEIEEDRRVLEQLMDRLDIGRDPVKRAVGWTTEKLGRLKLNGSLFSYSPLSRLVELETLTLGVTGKYLLWQALERAGLGPVFEGVDLPRMSKRAQEQLSQLEDYRGEAAREALVL